MVIGLCVLCAMAGVIAGRVIDIRRLMVMLLGGNVRSLRLRYGLIHVRHRVRLMWLVHVVCMMGVMRVMVVVMLVRMCMCMMHNVATCRNTIVDTHHRWRR